MNILLAGGSGLIGSRLRQQLSASGHTLTRLVRRSPESPDERFWNPERGELDPAVFEGVEGIIHLGGVGIADARWTARQKALIRDSRVTSTQLLARGAAQASNKPQVFVCASAIGYYGDRGDETLDERSPVGSGFLAEVCQAWEDATLPAQGAGVRVAHVRLGMVLAKEGGALGKMLLPFRMGAGGVMGSGRQFWSWVSIDDAVGIFEFALTCEDLSGPVNGVSPEPVTNREFTKALGRALHRPTIAPMPGFAARLVFGELADALMLASTRVLPVRLQGAGYPFRHPSLDGALQDLLK